MAQNIDICPQMIYNYKVLCEMKPCLICSMGVTMEQFKEKLKELRKKKGWAQEDLAREIDVSLSTVQRWEGKGAKPIRHARRALERLFREAGIDGD